MRVTSARTWALSAVCGAPVAGAPVLPGCGRNSRSTKYALGPPTPADCVAPWLAPCAAPVVAPPAMNVAALASAAAPKTVASPQARKPCAVSRNSTSSLCRPVHFVRERQARRRANAVRGTNVDAAELKLSVQNHGGDEIPLPQMRSASRMPEGCGSFPLFVHDARDVHRIRARFLRDLRRFLFGRGRHCFVWDVVLVQKIPQRTGLNGEIDVLRMVPVIC